MSLKFWLQQVPKQASFASINSFADFYERDSEQTFLLNDKLLSQDWLTIQFQLRSVLPILEMATRLFTLNSKKYKIESTYWLKYAFKVAGTLKDRKVPMTTEILEDEYDELLATEMEEAEILGFVSSYDFQYNQVTQDLYLEALIKRLEGFRMAIMIDH